MNCLSWEMVSGEEQKCGSPPREASVWHMILERSGGSLVMWEPWRSDMGMRSHVWRVWEMEFLRRRVD